MHIRTTLLTATMLTAVSSVALAQGYQHPKGFYVGAALGANFLTDSDLSGKGINGSAEFNIGPVGLLSAGYGFGNGLRSEIELGGRTNGVDKLNGNAVTQSDGRVNAYSAMLNLLYDINTGTAFTPYIGGGIGWAFLDVNDAKRINGFSVDDSDNRFAYQGIVGVAYSLSPQWKLSLDYRYFATLDPEFTAKNSAGTSVKVDSDYNTHSVMLGLRYHFWSPAAAAAPVATAVAVPAPVSEFPAGLL